MGAFDDDEPTTDKSLSLRNAWLEASILGDSINIRVGKLYRRFGPYHEILDTIPSFIGIETPVSISGERPMLTRTTHLMIHGRVSAGTSTVSYAMTVSRARSIFRDRSARQTTLHRRRWLGLVALIVLAVLSNESSSRAEPDELVLVLNIRNKEEPDISQIKRFYMGEAAFWSDNIPATLFVRAGVSRATEAFFLAIHVTPSRFRRLWQEKQLSGQGTSPEVIEAADTLLARVGADPGAVGFALSNELPTGPPGVRVLPLR